MAASAYLIFGDEYLASAQARSALATLVPDPGDPLSVEIIEGQADSADGAVQAVSRCREALATVGFFGGRKAVWFRGVNFLTDTTVGRAESVKSALAVLAGVVRAGLPDGVGLVVTAGEVDRRYAFFKAFDAAGLVHDFGVPKKPAQVREQALDRVRQCLADNGLRMASATLQGFVDKVGGDMRTIFSEVAKLAAYLGDRKEVTAEDVAVITCASSETVVWELQDALGRRELGTLLAVTRRLLFQGETPMRLIMLVEGRLRDLLVYREALERGWLRLKGSGWSAGVAMDGLTPEAAELLEGALGADVQSIHPFRLRVLVEQAAGFSVRELRRGLGAATQAHRQLVTSSLSPVLILETLLHSLLMPATARPAAVR